MTKLKFDVPQFLSVSLQDCLNYDIYPNLETLTRNAVESTLKKIEDYELNSKEQKVEYFLQHILLKLSSNNTWYMISNENNLDQLYLYKVIRKYLYLKDPDFIS